MEFDTAGFRAHFPGLEVQVHGRPLAYLDNAATTQAADRALDAVRLHYEAGHGNVHRGIHTVSERSTQAYEEARGTAAEFLGASADQVGFTSGTTDSINRVARALEERLSAGDEIVITRMEHHSNLLPWQELCRRTGAVLRTAPLTGEGELDLEALAGLMSSRTRLVAFTQCSNVLGTVNDGKAVCTLARQAGALSLVDGAQGAAHLEVDVRELGCDFYCCSGHKLFAPTGIGLLYLSRRAAEQLPPPVYGGGMVETVGISSSTYAAAPLGWEAGTPNFVGAVALAEALRFRREMGGPILAARSAALLQYGEEGLSALPGVRILGRPACRRGALSFTVDGAHPFDIAAMLDQLGVAVRSGTHCAQPLLQSLGADYAVRMSPAAYNTREEMDRLLDGLEQVISLLRRSHGV